MNKTAISKTVLNVYSNLELVCKHIDKAVSDKSLRMAQSTHAYLGKLMNVFEDISQLIVRKSKLINLKVYCELALAKLNTDLASILYLKFIDKFSIKQLSEFQEVSERTILRRIDTAISTLGIKLIEVGLTEEKFKIVIENENWIKKIFNYFNGIKLPNDKELFIENGLVTQKSLVNLTKREFKCS